ncbi:hypothetical protein LIER_44008 [Lithospermum erythrorhizon]|uniref:Polyprotein n=1 Tax=Lithospermum erythrorhizon TaxID=34254 RepID=A0AAV3RN51_LITER
MLFYVDDIIFSGTDPQAIQAFTDALDGSLFLSQRQYIVDFLDRMSMSSCKGVSIPMATSTVLTSDGDLSADPLYDVPTSAYTDVDWAGSPDDRSSTGGHAIYFGSTYLAANPIYHARNKHTEIDYHFVREKLATSQLQIRFMTIKDQIADMFTKALPVKSFSLFRDKLQVGLSPLACWGRGGGGIERAGPS